MRLLGIVALAAAVLGGFFVPASAQTFPGQLPANSFQCNDSTSTAFPTNCNYPTVNVKDPAYGAKGDGSTDDTTAIQNAINSLPAAGGTVLFPVGFYKISAAITIGNGNSTPTNSTVSGVILQGMANNAQTLLPGFPNTQGAKLSWSGPINTPMIAINGPLQGWGVQNLLMDCQSTSGSTGIIAHAVTYGDSRNLTIVNCNQGILTNSYPNRGSLHNGWRNIYIQIPNITNAIGAMLDGDGIGNTSNTSFDHYENIFILMPVATVVGLYLREVDSTQFYNVHIAGGGAAANGIVFDYTGTGISGVWPASNMFYGLEPSEQTGAIINTGTPGAGARPNVIYGFEETNGAVIPTINNLSVHASNAIVVSPGGNNASTNLLSAWTASTPSPSCGTATFGSTGLRTKTMGKTTFAQVEINFTAIGSCTNNFTFTLPNTVSSTSVLVGQETVSNNTVVCRLAAASATATCIMQAGANYGATSHIQAAGVYENQ